MHKKNNLQSGFTLIEVIVVIGIMGILMGIAIPSELSYRKRLELKSAVKDLRSLYWDAQSRSLAPRTKNITAYAVTVVKQPGPIGQNNIVRGQECVQDHCSDQDFRDINLGANIFVKDIITSNCDTANVSPNALISLFDVGNNKDSGLISFYKSYLGEEIKCGKIEILVASVATAPGFEYKIVLDKENNSIDYILNK